MNQFKSSMLAATSAIFATASILLSIVRVNASEEKQNYVAPSLGLINGKAIYGLTAKFGVAENISVRTFIEFLTTGADTSSSSPPFSRSLIDGITVYGSSINYNFNIPNSRLIPYVGIGYLGTISTGSRLVVPGVYGEFGADYNVGKNLSLNANYKTANYGGINFGLGFKF